MSENTVCNTAQRFMTMKELANYARVTTRTLQNWKHLGMPYVKVAGSVRVKLTDFDNWMDGFKVTDAPREDLKKVWHEVMEEVKNED